MGGEVHGVGTSQPHALADIYFAHALEVRERQTSVISQQLADLDADDPDWLDLFNQWLFGIKILPCQERAKINWQQLGKAC